MKLHIGCGDNIKKGYINLDFMRLPGVDVVHDLNKFPWPFKDNTFNEVRGTHIFEHLSDLPATMKEIHRITKKGGRVVIRGPHFSCGVSYRDPTHKTLFSYFTFDYFSDPADYYKRRESGLFKIEKRFLNFTRFAYPSLNYIFNPLINANPAIYERFFCWIFPCSEAIFYLKVIK